MFKTITERYSRDKDFPERAFRLTILRAVLEGTFYDVLPHPFHLEQTDANEYVPLRDRRPSVRCALCRIVVDDSVSLLFDEGHFPTVDHPDETTKASLTRIIKETGLNEVMIAGATSGSVGSVCFSLQVLSGRVFFRAMNTEYLTPTWNPDAPDELLKVTENYKVKGAVLKELGYSIATDRLQAQHFYQRVWTEAESQVFVPWTKEDEARPGFSPQIDHDLTVAHKLGFVPMVWTKNLPGGDDIDGAPTFPGEAIDTQIEIDYQLSQAGRGLKYSSDPTLLIKEPATSDGGAIIRSASSAIVVDADGDAKMLEINGTAVAAVLDYVKHLRETALEALHGNRASAEKLSTAQSGKAMELMYQALVWLADRLRISYGEGALLSLLQMVVKASNKLDLVYKDGSRVGKLNETDPVSLRWPSWFKATPDELMNRATTLTKLCDAGLLSRETAIKILAADYDIENPEAEKALANADMALRNAEAKKQVSIAE